MQAHPCASNAPRTPIERLVEVAADHVGLDFFQRLVDELADITGAALVFITRAVDYPATQVAILASSQGGPKKPFLLAGTPCEETYDGQVVCISRGVCRLYEPARASSLESYHGTPFFNAAGECISHLGIFFTTPKTEWELLDLLAQRLKPRIEAELRQHDDNTRLETLRQRTDFHNRVLHRATHRQPLDSVLEELVRGIEKEQPHLLCSVMLPTPSGKHLRVSAAPSLPVDYLLAIDQTAIAAGAECCGTAAYTGELVVAEEVADDSDWTTFRQHAVPHGLASCWSQPIKDQTGKVLAVFSVYRTQRGLPSHHDLELIDSVSSLIALILQHYAVIESLRNKSRRYQLFLQAAVDGTVVIDLDGRFIEVTDGFLRMVGASRSELIASRIWDWNADQDEATGRRQLASFVEHPVTYETLCRRADGSLWNAEVTATAFTIDGETMIWASSRDITHRKQTEQAQHTLASTDPLTGVLNQPALIKHLEAEFQSAQRHASKLCVLIFEIDHFKNINDHHGHAAGDEALRQVLGNCCATLRLEDRIGRLGGEEFAIILSDTSIDGALVLAERLLKQVTTSSIQYIDHGVTHSFALTCSIGLASLDGAERDHQELLSLAGKAISQAKAKGRNQVCCAPTDALFEQQASSVATDYD